MSSSYLGMLLRVLIKLLKWIVFVGAVFSLCVYGFEARERSINLPHCEWFPIPNTEGTPYSARVCYLTRETTLLRVYDESGVKLLAERSHLRTGVEIHWFPKKIIYDTTDHEIFDDGTVFLPPSTLNSLRAKLP